ncbi:NADPH-dependent 2,4-dienoyl-CoA reductase/sulfur reductase-like enzyme [Humitalea rosea]|uniref:NADPH-dependent 2,4-dienoyl-CoA reductase/sulfur reductase-like enzyme n=1 Tax=Humitalea rosea TaxID=990373 RepID=A0A2W7IMY9_9PROT|nr:FAD-dependent oxidoreductase [Humitalea rosea]PZW47145.1 NADPH-dependent 2,4-dienoyl-CoA reductase/sulfur reductase-like enzyme [Humitalea rosea]
MRIAVVGAGPAGVRAVQTLVAAGHRPAWLDEAPDGGGRIYQRPPAALNRDAKMLYGFEAKRATALHDTLDAMKPRTDWRPDTFVWHIRPGVKRLQTLHRGVQAVVDYDAVLLCTGAMDRVVPVPGWTLPGVTTMGAAQIALKTQGCGIGSRVAFLGSGPLLWLVAYQYARAGADVVAVLDTTSFATKARAAFGLLRGGATFAKGLYYIGWLRAHGIRIDEGVTPVAIEGAGSGVTGLDWRDARGRAQRVDCDAVGIGWGLRPEAQLADLAGIPFRFDAIQHNWVPERDLAGRTSVEGHYLAGDGAGIGGAEVAELAGARAALALLQDAGAAVDAAEAARLDRALTAAGRFRVALERASPYPAHLAAGLPDDTILCRCEGLRVGELRAAAAEEYPAGRAPEMNRAKAFTRTGMGRCQGRVCGAAAAEILAAALGVPVDAIGRLRGQPPVKPIPIVAPPAEAVP